jgi:hypothetical protein
MATFWRVSARSAVPVAAAVSQVTWRWATCEEMPTTTTATMAETTTTTTTFREGMQPDVEGDFHGLFPRRQLWQSKLPYPLWDSNWDGKEPPLTGDKDHDRHTMRRIRKTGVTRHLILVRHGQYDESFKVRSSTCYFVRKCDPSVLVVLTVNLAHTGG